MQAEWLAGVKKNLELESQVLRLDNECAELRERLEARGR